jgi:hypothetical protein
MNLTFTLHWVGTGSSKGCGVNLCHFVTLMGNGRGKHSVSEHGVRESFVPQHPVIGREVTGEGRVETGPHPVLGCHDHRAFSTVR